MEVTKQQQNSVQTSGGALAVFLDVDGVLKLKDLRGNIQPLTDFLSQIIYLLEDKNSFRPANGKNVVSGEFSAILSGNYNVNRGSHNSISGGEANTTDKSHSFIGGGKNNEASGDFSSILGGRNNNTMNHENVHLIGSDLIADEDNTTFVNSLRVKDMPKSPNGQKSGKLWNDKGIVKIVE